MAKRGRPGMSYEKFVAVWEQLLNENRATTNEAHERLGGSKLTIRDHREKYERTQASKELARMRSIELPEAVCRAIAGIKTKEIHALEKEKARLLSRNDEYRQIVDEERGKRVETQVNLEDAKMQFSVEKLALERKLAAAQARIDDLKQREQKYNMQYEQLNKQYNEAKQEAAVAKKEVDMLREQVQKS